jgi:hypothetical protein
MNMHTFSIIHNLRSRADRADRSLDGSLAVLAYFATASEFPKSKNEGCSEVSRSQNWECITIITVIHQTYVRRYLSMVLNPNLIHSDTTQTPHSQQIFPIWHEIS